MTKTIILETGEVPVNDNKCWMVYLFGKLQDYRNVPNPMEAGILWIRIATKITMPRDDPPCSFPDATRLLTTYYEIMVKNKKFEPTEKRATQCNTISHRVHNKSQSCYICAIVVRFIKFFWPVRTYFRVQHNCSTLQSYNI